MINSRPEITTEYHIRHALRLLLAAAVILAAVFFTAAPSFAESSEIAVKRGKADTSDGYRVTFTCDGEAAALYLIFDHEPGEWTLSAGSGEAGSAQITAGQNGFLHEYVEVESRLGRQNTMTLHVPSGEKPKDIRAFDGTDVPSWVQIWQPPCDQADVLLFSSHADDEQLFFAGILPYYAQVRGLAVQVVYATDHTNQIVRHHERLNGLWEVGIRNYPVSSGYPDLYSESYEQALANLKPYGITEETVIAWEQDILERFRPQVVVTHDFAGEYGHGMHILVANSLARALADADGQEHFSYLKKVYFHLYDKNPVVLSWMDEPADALGGLTPFQVTQKGFGHHESQHWTWFKRWIWGNNNDLKRAADIQTYSPLRYGLWFSAVGEDEAKNDLFEHVTSYEQQRLDEEARLAAEEAARKAEEEAKAEAARLADEARLAEAALAAMQKEQRLRTIILVACAAVAAVAVAILAASRPKKKGKH